MNKYIFNLIRERVVLKMKNINKELEGNKKGFYEKPLIINDVLRKRVQVLINYLEQKLEFGTVIKLKRKEVMNIVGVSEGDSAKKLFRVLNEAPEEYNQKITYEKEDKLYVFGLAENNVFINAADQVVELENFASWKKDGTEKYVGFMRGSEIVKYWDAQTITYNPCIQRGTKTIVKGGETVEEDICSTKNIGEIANMIKKDEYVTDTITLNVMGAEVNYQNGKLLILKNRDSEINILDGQHRTKSLIRISDEISSMLEIRKKLVELIHANHISDISELAKRAKEESISLTKLLDNSSITMEINNTPEDLINLINNITKINEHLLDDIVFPIQIEVLSKEKAQSAFAQFTKGLKIATTRKEFLDNTNPYTIFLKESIDSCDSYYKGKIEEAKDNIKGTNKLVAFGTLATATKFIKEDDLTDEFKEYFKMFFNKLGKRIYDGENKNEKFSLLRENIAYYGYISIAKELFDNKFDLEINFEEIYNKIYVLAQDEVLWKENILRRGKTGFTIINNRDTRKFVFNKFKQLIAA